MDHPEFPKNFCYDSYIKSLHNILFAMDQHLQKLGEQLQRLDRVIQPYKWSNQSAQEIQHLFQEMNKTIDDAEHWVATKRVLVDGDRECQPTKLKFQVPLEGIPNKGMWEATVCFYLDKLTNAVNDDNKEDYESALFSLIDVGRAYDREMDPDGDAWELHDDKNRAGHDLYGNIYEDGFDRPKDDSFLREVIYGPPKEVAKEANTLTKH